MERKILSTALNSREHWQVLKDNLDKQSLAPNGQLLFEAITKYYTTDQDARSVDRELLCSTFDRTIESARVRQLLVSLIRELPADTSGANVLNEVKEHKKHVIGSRLSHLLSTNGDPHAVADLMDQYRSIEMDVPANVDDSGEDAYTGQSIAALSNTSFSGEGLIEVWPPVLNDQIDGGARRGHHILVFAPVEMGKTLVAVNMCAGFLKQGLKVLYMGNEDPAADILMRMATRLTGRTKYEVVEDPQGTDQILNMRNWGLFTFVSMAPGNFNRVNHLVNIGGYDVVVFDQLHNFDVNYGNRTESLERAAIEARNVAKRHNVLVVSLTQAADSASGKRILSRGDVNGSNVGIPAQVDLMLGIGADASMEATNMRCITPVKNKLSGNHSPIMVEIDPSTSRILI